MAEKDRGLENNLSNIDQNAGNPESGSETRAVWDRKSQLDMLRFNVTLHKLGNLRIDDAELRGQPKAEKEAELNKLAIEIFKHTFPEYKPQDVHDLLHSVNLQEQKNICEYLKPISRKQGYILDWKATKKSKDSISDTDKAQEPGGLSDTENRSKIETVLELSFTPIDDSFDLYWAVGTQVFNHMRKARSECLVECKKGISAGERELKVNRASSPVYFSIPDLEARKKVLESVLKVLAASGIHCKIRAEKELVLFSIKSVHPSSKAAEALSAKHPDVVQAGQESKSTKESGDDELDDSDTTINGEDSNIDPNRKPLDKSLGASKGENKDEKETDHA